MELREKQKWHKYARNFFRDITDIFEIPEQHRATFLGTIRNLNIYHKANDEIDRDGITYKTKSNQIKKNPACQIAKESWSGFLQG